MYPAQLVQAVTVVFQNSDQRDQIKTGQREFVGAAVDKQQPVARGGGCGGLRHHVVFSLGRAE
nr:hypothetical protein [uncultured Ottowia sp.]